MKKTIINKTPKTIYLLDNKAGRRMGKKFLKSKEIGHPVILVFLPVHTAIATLDMPKGVAKRGAKAKLISDTAAASTLVSVDPLLITAINTLITAYNNATPSGRLNAFRLMNNSLKNDLMPLFQKAADADPGNSVAIIQSGGFGVKGEGGRQVQKFEAMDGTVLGTVLLTAEGGGSHTAHDWMYSHDGITFVRMIPTIGANTEITGLVSGEWAYFVHQLITKNGGQGFSQIIKIRVK